MISRKYKIDISGDVFGKLTAIKRQSECNNTYWLFSCTCGNEKVINRFDVIKGRTISCGCYCKEATVARSTTHGLTLSKEWRCWVAMKSRCLNANSKQYSEYGGKGITICNDFMDFEIFIKHIGNQPSDGKRYSIDRINNKEGYCIGNVRWATYTQQSRNKGLKSNCNTGVSGVWFSNRSGYSTCVGSYVDAYGKKRAKEISIKKYGIMESFAMACKFRDEGIKSLIGTSHEYFNNPKEYYEN